MAKFANYTRRKTSTTHVGNLCIGSDYPIRIQSMANTSTNDIEASVAQTLRVAQAGADLFRFTTQGIKEVESLAKIHSQLSTNKLDGFSQLSTLNSTLSGRMPLVADIHFRSDVADAAAAVVEKVRINPGNYANDPATIRERFTHLIYICKEHHTALRIGVNHGSLSKRMMDLYGDTPKGMVESAMEFLRIAVEEDFHDIVLSIKASNTAIMVETVLLLVETMDKENMHFPLHLGVTEAGEGQDGRIKSAVGIGALLAAGIGDTIRVSLSEEPEAEVPVAKALVDYFTNPNSPRYTDNITPPLSGEAGKGLSHLEKLYIAAEAGYTMLVKHEDWSYPEDEALQNDILQAAGKLRYKTEFVSCPGCGRTMFDLQKTVHDIKEALSAQRSFSTKCGLSAEGGLTAQSAVFYPKIAIMGCIVNGPGEMADADYGYVGAGKDRVSLYRKKECVLKNIPQEEAVAKLIELIDADRQRG
ncbi:MAG: (E)-4-hydroxy-3-methylbut-2-enyl-diphosphate synthase [Paludibacteraceae bacterium]|nr:(E)-4-hydroxy-3-methylbut-2-enyl-diphosphate synthase [Paludibacteraceae bacterium]